MARIDYYNDPAAPPANSIVVAVTAFVQNDAGHILMIRRTDNNLYSIPGGAQEIGETITQTVTREVEEETGIQVQVTGLVGIYSDPAHVIAFTNGEVRQEFSICFRAHPTGGILRSSSESSDVLWVEPGRLDYLVVHPSIRLRIEHGLLRLLRSYYM